MLTVNSTLPNVDTNDASTKLLLALHHHDHMAPQVQLADFACFRNFYKYIIII